MNTHRLIKTTALAALALGALHLAACATPYQELGGLRGGVRAVQITSNIAQVTARGTSATDPDKVQRYALRKAAETTRTQRVLTAIAWKHLGLQPPQDMEAAQFRLFQEDED